MTTKKLCVDYAVSGGEAEPYGMTTKRDDNKPMADNKQQIGAASFRRSLLRCWSCDPFSPCLLFSV